VLKIHLRHGFINPMVNGTKENLDWYSKYGQYWSFCWHSSVLTTDIIANCTCKKCLQMLRIKETDALKFKMGEKP